MREETALKYLLKNQLHHIGMIEPIRKASAEVLYADEYGVLIREIKSNAYMISADSYEKGREILGHLSECNLMVAHQEEMVDYIQRKYRLKDKMECFQAVYMKDRSLEESNELAIRQLTIEQKETILENYHVLSEVEITELLKDGRIFGGYREETLVGFAGIHQEGSIGLLEIFPENRCRGYGTILESYLVNQVLARGGVPFVQIKPDNTNSIALQKKLGFQFSEQKIYWMY